MDVETGGGGSGRLVLLLLLLELVQLGCPTDERGRSRRAVNRLAFKTQPIALRLRQASVAAAAQMTIVQGGRRG